MSFFVQRAKTLSLAFVIIFYSVSRGYSQQVPSIAEYEKMLEQSIQAKDNGKASFYSYEIAKQYVSTNQLDKANQYLNQCLTYGKKANDGMLMYLATRQLAMNAVSKNDYDKALENFQKAQRLAEEQKRSDFIMESLIQVAVSQSQLGRYKKAIESLDRALSISLQQ